MPHFEKMLSSEVLYRGKIVTLYRDQVELENGAAAVREVVRHHGGVAVLALDEDNSVLFVRQFRYPYGETLLELPAGKLNPGEDPAACGMRELMEETGYEAGTCEFLARVYPTPGYTDEILHLYVAKNLQFVRQKLDEDEFLTVEKIPFEKALALCLDGGITDAKTLISILKYNAVHMRGKC